MISAPKRPALTHVQSDALHWMSLVCASSSIIAGLLATFWFVRMRRSFRHDLIMFLVVSDMFKCLFFLAHSAVELVNGTIPSSSPYCQASGFLLALSIEAADIGIIMVSVHTALFVFRGEQGLYPYRKIAYAAFCIVPMVLASLAFVNNIGYVNTGQFCYLPVDPSWTRMALSWVPRYITFAIILFVSVSIYIYVRVLMNRFGSRQGDEELPSTVGHESVFASTKQTISVPPTPTIDHHGLMPSVVPFQRDSGEERPRQASVCSANTITIEYPGATFNSKLHSNQRRRFDRPKRWTMDEILVESPLNMYQPGMQSEPDLPAMSMAPVEETGGMSPDGFPDRERDRRFSVSSKGVAPFSGSTDSTIIVGRPGRRGSIATSFPSTRSPSLPNIRSVAYDGSGSWDDDMHGTGPDHHAETMDVSHERLSSGVQVIKTRDKIRRQLRLLFVYPVIYLVAWLIPFIVHLTGFGNGAPYGLRMVSVMCLCLHGLADALVFTLREQPWKHGRRRSSIGAGIGLGIGGIRARFLAWRRRAGECGSGGGGVRVGPKVGRTREEMRMDGRRARERRDMEMAEWRHERNDSRKLTATTTDWWDHDHDHV